MAARLSAIMAHLRAQQPEHPVCGRLPGETLAELPPDHPAVQGLAEALILSPGREAVKGLAAELVGAGKLSSIAEEIVAEGRARRDEVLGALGRACGDVTIEDWDDEDRAACPEGTRAGSKE